MLAWHKSTKAAFWCATLSAVCWSSCAAHEINWAVSIGAAKRQASDEGKLVALFHLPNPAITDTAASDANEAITVASIQANGSAFQQNFVGYRRHVGVPSPLSRSKPKSNASARPRESTKRQDLRLVEPLRRPVVYFCTPDLEVIHFVTGYAAPDYLRQAMKWSVRTWQNIQAEAGADREKRKQWLQTAHFDEVTALDEELFGRTLRQAHRQFADSDHISEADIRFYVDTAARLRFLAAKRSLTDQVADAQLIDIAHRLAIDGEQTPTIAHLLSGHMPLVAVDKVATAYYEILADGGVFDPRCRRIQALSNQLAADRQRHRAAILHVLPYEPRTQSRGLVRPAQFKWLKNSAVQKRLQQFDQMNVTVSELAALLYLHGEPALEVPGSARVAFVFLDSAGNHSGTVLDNTSLKEFSRQLRLAAR